jgi:hypothetical protein
MPGFQFSFKRLQIDVWYQRLTRPVPQEESEFFGDIVGDTVVNSREQDECAGRRIVSVTTRAQHNNPAPPRRLTSVVTPAFRYLC